MRETGGISRLASPVRGDALRMARSRFACLAWRGRAAA